MNDSGQPQGSSPSLQDAEEVSTQPISSSQEMASADETVLDVAPIQIERASIRQLCLLRQYLKTQEQTSSSFKLAVAYDYHSLCSRCWSRKFRVHRYSDTPDRRFLVPLRLSWHDGGPFLAS